MSDLGTHYGLVGNVATNLTSATLTATTQGAITLIVNAEGIWAFEFSDAQKQVLVKLIAGKKMDEAQTLLFSQAGVKRVDIQFSRDTLPTDASRITIVVKGEWVGWEAFVAACIQGLIEKKRISAIVSNLHLAFS